MQSWKFVALGAASLLLILAIWVAVPDRHEPALPAGVSPQAVERSEAVRERLRELGAARLRERPPEAAAPGRLVVPGAAPPGSEESAGAALRSGAEAAGRAAGARPRPEGVGTSGEAALQSDHVAMPDPEDLPVLKEMSLHDADAQRRLAAVTLLGASDDPGVVPILAQALLDENEDVRLAAVQALGDFTADLPVEALEGALKDPSPDVRYEALELLAEAGGDAARRAAARALEDPDDDVRDLARIILGEQP